MLIRCTVYTYTLHQIKYLKKIQYSITLSTHMWHYESVCWLRPGRVTVVATGQEAEECLLLRKDI